MTAVVKTQIQAVGKDSLPSTNIPFLDSNPDAFLTGSQKDFQPFSSKKAETFSKPAPAQVDHKDLRYIKEHLIEADVSSQGHPLPEVTGTPRWNMLLTNFKMQTDHREVTFLTTYAQAFRSQPFQPPPTPTPTPIRHTDSIQKIRQVEKLESTSMASFTPHHVSPVVKATVKHLEEGFPSIQGDRRYDSFVSQHSDTFQGAWGRAAQSVKKRTTSVVLGDPVKIVERDTTYAASFNRPTVCRQPVVKDHLERSLGTSCEDTWSSSYREDFKLGKPVVLTKGNQNSSSLPKGHSDPRQNKGRMSVTTNRISFSDLNHTQRPVHVSGPELLTRSNVQFSPPRLSGLEYTTTAKDHCSKQDTETRTEPQHHQD